MCIASRNELSLQTVPDMESSDCYAQSSRDMLPVIVWSDLNFCWFSRTCWSEVALGILLPLLFFSSR